MIDITRRITSHKSARFHIVCLVLASFGSLLPEPSKLELSKKDWSTMRFSRNQIIGAILLLTIIWLVIAIRFIIAR